MTAFAAVATRWVRAGALEDGVDVEGARWCAMFSLCYSLIMQDAPRRRWPRWLAVNLAILAGSVVAAYLLVLVPAALAGWDADADAGEGSLGSYSYALIFLPFTWPLYMLALVWVAGRVRRPRGWAVALCPLLGAPLNAALLLVTLPGIAAAWVTYLLYGALVRLPREAHARGPRAHEK